MNLIRDISLGICVGFVLALMIEVGELGELLLWKNDDEVGQQLRREEWRSRLGQELADVQIFLLYLAEATGLDLTREVLDKMEINGSK